MPLDHIRGKRRVVRVALAAGLVAALTTTGISASTAFADTPGDPADAAVKTAHDKLGSADAELLAEAKADGDKNVTMMIATAPGSTEQVADELGRAQGRLGGPDVRQARLRPRHRPDRQGRRGDRGGREALLRARRSTCSRRSRSTTRRPAADTAQGPPRATARQATAPRRTRGPTRRPRRRTRTSPTFETGAVDFVKEQPEGGRPRRHHRHPRLGRRPRPPGAAEDHHRRAQDRRLGHRHRPDHRRRRHLAADDHRRSPARPSPTGGRTWTAPPGDATRSTASPSPPPRAATWPATSTATATPPTCWGVLYDPATGTVRVDLNDNGDFTDDTADEAVQGRLPDRLLRHRQPGHRRRRADPVRRRDPQGRRHGPVRRHLGRQEGRLRQHRRHRVRARHPRRRHHRRQRPVRRQDERRRARRQDRLRPAPAPGPAAAPTSRSPRA